MRTLPFVFLAAALGCRSTPDETGTETDTVVDDSGDTDTEATDADGDGVPEGEDCDDADPAVNPGAAEACNGKDDDCDGETDEGVQDTWYTDGDGDGYGAAEVLACEPPTGAATKGGDCDDAAADVHPDAEEACTDTVDKNCDGSVAFADADGDGFAACEECDDADASRNPDATESCNEADDDCDGETDEGVTSTFYADSDGDGFGAPSAATEACAAPTGYVSDATDCDDAAAGAHPGATESCDGTDEDCDGETDEGVKSTFYADADGDGYGASSATTEACAAPSGFVSDSTDCDDAAAAVHPGATEACNGTDDDCSGAADEGVTTTFYADTDGDGFGDEGATKEACSLPSGFVANADDCDDGAAAVKPGAEEVCNEADDDCDGGVDVDASDALTFHADADGDGWRASDDTVEACVAPDGYVEADAEIDCDDTSASVTACKSCGEAESGGVITGSGVVKLDPCGTGAKDYWCDMDTLGGGWIVAGWQAANATTTLGISNRNKPGDADFSSDLACFAYTDILVFNKTHGEAYKQSYGASTWTQTTGQFGIGPAGKAFKHGTYGPGGMMGCVDYAYSGGVFPQYACDNDSAKGQKGHLTGYAGEFCSGGRLDNTWAWTDGNTCLYRGSPYVWGYAIR